MKNKYYNDAIIGNENIVASLSNKGELLRFCYSSRDYKQFVDEFITGVKINDSMLINLHDDINNVYKQEYIENTNILQTEIENKYFNLKIEQTDFVSIKKNVLIKKYRFTNCNSINLDVDFLVYSKLFTNFNNMVGSRVEENVLEQYSHDYTFGIFSDKEIQSYRLNNSFEEMKSGIVRDKDYIGMAEDSCISFKIGELKPNEVVDFNLFITINDNSEKLDYLSLKKTNVEKELDETKKYWQNYVKKHDGLKLLDKEESKEKKIYIRTILLFPLLTNSKTGGIIAAMEVDEQRQKSGRYAYCWPRDAVYITKALDILKMEDITTKFYCNFCKNTQSKNGMWEQRFYTDGRLAPCWGYQIDETASVVYGVYEHYKVIKDINFLKDTYDMCKKAISAIENYMFDTNFLISRFKTHVSYDIWEMHEGVHLYSISAIFAAFKAMIKIEKILNEKKDTNRLEELAEKVKEYSMKEFLNDDRTLKRNNKDNICDISVLGTVIPFNMYDKNQKEVQNTIQRIEMNLKTYTGGYIRFENDNYMGGNNPWPIATLWMALYNMEIENKEEAQKQINFVTNTASQHGFLAEQVDNSSMSPKWVLGLGWSHAMYIISLSQL
ncbi:MAG: hypothetical protein J6M60_05640 [Clostridia bacterium]|nr:hypothetical protein [Clostridia bacterium]